MAYIEELAGYELGDKPHEECGVVALVDPDLEAGLKAARAITELANRGREATGVGVFTPDGEALIHKDHGTGDVVFPDRGVKIFGDIPADIGTAQSRYSTQGNLDISGAQPYSYTVEVGDHSFSFICEHNGNLINTRELARHLDKEPGDFHSDSDLMGQMFAESFRRLLELEGTENFDPKTAVLLTLPLLEGAFTGAVALEDQIFVFNDHHGLKPGMIGELPNGGVIVASEVTALDAVYANFKREMEPGELINMGLDGTWTAEQWAKPEPKGCLLELFYFMRLQGMRVDRTGTRAVFRGVNVQQARYDAGRALALADTNLEADMIIGIPNSAVVVGDGYADASGLPHDKDAMIARRTDRSFIAPTQADREAAVESKIEIRSKRVEDKRVVAVDDSAIRGTTLRKLARMLRENGAAEVHARSALPQVVAICDRGVDISETDSLIASGRTDEEINHELGVDSMRFNTIDAVKEYVLKEASDRFCMGCLTGEYPGAVPTLAHDVYRQYADFWELAEAA